MTSKQIWNDANDHRELIRSIYHALKEGRGINEKMDSLKRHIPCLFGIDYDRHALVFKSSDEGMVAVLTEEVGDTFALALTTNIDVEKR